MPFSIAEQTQLKALITREGGLKPFRDELESLNSATTQAVAITTLAPAITVTVQDWNALQSYVAQASNVTLLSVMAAIQTAAAAKDASQLGPLFVALYAASKAHYGM